jgi:hypothetical protein
VKYVLGLIGIIFGVCLIIWRQRVGDEFGEQEWAYRIGGVYNVVIIVGIFMIFWSIAYMVDTMEFFFWPILMFLPIRKPDTGDGGVPLEELNQLWQQGKVLVAMATGIVI